MLSPSPTQQQRDQSLATIPPETPPVPRAPKKVRPGQTPGALFVKSIVRPFIKLFYYIITGIRTHKTLTFIAIILLLASVSATTLLTIGQLPFGIANDPFNFHINGGDGGGGKVQSWLYALRDGNTTQMQLLDRDMSTQPDVNQLTGTYSQPKAHVSWQSINVLGTRQEADGTIDSIVEVDLAASGPGNQSTATLILHFVTASSGTTNYLLNATVVDTR